MLKNILGYSISNLGDYISFGVDYQSDPTPRCVRMGLGLQFIINAKNYKISNKYQFLDEIFLRVLEKHPEKMPDIFSTIFNASTKSILKFLSNKSNIFEDFSIILKMPKLVFIKALFDK